MTSERPTATTTAAGDGPETQVDWQRRVVGRSLRSATERSVDRANRLIKAAGVVLDRADGGDITVQDVADEAGQSLRTLYQYFESKDDLLLALFEESMRAYARLLETAVADIEDPLDRLIGAVVAAQRMPELSASGFDRGLVRLRLRLADTAPEQVGRAQWSLSSLLASLVKDAADAGAIEINDVESATFLLMSVNAAVITAQRVGNDAGVAGPDLVTSVSFCLRGLGAGVDVERIADVDRRIALPRPAPDRRPGPAATDH